MESIFLTKCCLRWRERGKLAFILLSFLFGFTLMTGCSLQSETSQLRLGIWAAEHDLWDEAIFRWQKALEKDPNSAVLHNNLAVAYEKKGLWEKARAEYELALKLAPENRYIKANFRYFEENLKAAEKAEKAEEKKTGQKEEKKKGELRPESRAFILNSEDEARVVFPLIN